MSKISVERCRRSGRPFRRRPSRCSSARATRRRPSTTSRPPPPRRQTVYNHFGDKERLFLAVVDDEITGTLAELRAAPRPSRTTPRLDPEQELADLARRVVRTFLSPRTARLRVLVQSEAPRNPQLLELWQERAVTPLVWSVLIGHLARLAHAGSLALEDPVRAAGQFVALVDRDGVGR